MLVIQNKCSYNKNTDQIQEYKYNGVSEIVSFKNWIKGVGVIMLVV